MVNHFHIHYIVPGGGIAVREDGKERWAELPKKGNFIFPKKVMSDLFRGKFIALLKKKGLLKRPYKPSRYPS